MEPFVRVAEMETFKNKYRVLWIVGVRSESKSFRVKVSVDKKLCFSPLKI